ncbi:uncharacterized protein LOC126713645 [Quercus robur]|uniref:uncharacterized protein LOC126713645 n=1 Tax=Quercus robur TaxID=38942 RepID=UPI002163D9A6|nr:uncharacterized protein LOC126713645 [Quercus robur]
MSTGTNNCVFYSSIVLLLLTSIALTGYLIRDTVLVINSPRFPEFRVDSLSVSNLSYTYPNFSVSGNWNARFSVQNPNKKFSISYDLVQSTLVYEPKSLHVYEPEFISEIGIPDFNQSMRKETFIDAAFAVSDAYRSMSLGYINVDSTVSFVVKFLGRIKFKDGRGRLVKDYWGREALKVHCEGLVVSLASSHSGASISGKLVEPRDCKIL